MIPAGASVGPSAGPWLAIDAATRWTTVAVARDGAAVSGVQHERTSAGMLAMIDDVLTGAGHERRDVRGVVVGTGPGSFTGLRVAAATAKTIAHELDIPLLGVTTAEALARSAVTADRSLADRPLAVVMPAGARDHYLTFVRCGAQGCSVEQPELVPPDTGLAELIGAARIIALDVKPALVDPEAISRGQQALAGLGAALLEVRADRSRRGQPADDAVTLLPTYVALPRGVRPEEGPSWSPDLR